MDPLKLGHSLELWGWRIIRTDQGSTTSGITPDSSLTSTT